MFIVAIDFDGTLVKDKFPEIGEINIDLFNSLIKLKDLHEDELRYILWTCRHGKYLDEAVAFCVENGLTFDAINDNLPEIKKGFDNNTRKVFAHIYIDDRNVLLSDSEEQLWRWNEQLQTTSSNI